MANKVLNLEVDWAGKSGAADAIIAFNETFDIKIVGDLHADSTLYLTLLSQSVSAKEAILWTKTPTDITVNEDNTILIRDVRINTADVLDVLKAQGGKSKLFLSLLEYHQDGTTTDYGISKITLTLGSYIEDPDIPPNTEVGGMSVAELQQYVDEMLKKILKAESDATNAKNEAKGYAEEARDVKAVAQGAAVNAESAKLTAEIAEQVAKGAQYAKVFATELDMKTWAAREMAKDEAEREVKVGDNLYIIDTGVPDYWWSGEGDGYAQLETGAVNVTVDTELSETSNNPVANKVIKSKTDALEQQIASETTRASTIEQAIVAKNTEQSQQITAVQGDIEKVRSYLIETNTTPIPTGDVDAFGYRGTLADLGVNGAGIKIYSLSITTRNGTNQNNNVSLWARVLRKENGNWVICAQSITSRKWNEVGQAQELTWEMTPVAGVAPPTISEEVAIIWVNNANAAATSLNGAVSFKTASGRGGFTSESLTATLQNWMPIIRLSYQSVPLAGGGIPTDACGNYDFDKTVNLGTFSLTPPSETGSDSTWSKGSLCVYSGNIHGHGWGLEPDYLCLGNIKFGPTTLGQKLCALVNNQIGGGSGDSSGGSVTFPLQIPKGECIEFGTTKFQTYGSDDIRFNLNNGTFCIEGGHLILGNGSNFRAGDFCMSGLYLGKALDSLIDGGVSQYIAFNTDGNSPRAACAYPNSIAIGPEAQTYCSENIVIGLGNRAIHSTGQRLISMYTEDSPDQDVITDIAFCLRNPIIFSNGMCSNVFFGYDDNACSMAIGSYFTKSNGCMGSVIIPFSSLGGGGRSGSGGGSSNPLISINTSNTYCSSASGSDAIAVGRDASAVGNNSTAIGAVSNVNGDFGVAIGYDSLARFGEVAIGVHANTHNQLDLKSHLDGYGLFHRRIFSACSSGHTADHAFFAACNGHTVIGGTVSYDYANGKHTYGYVSIKDLIDVVNNGGGDGSSASGSASYWTNEDGKVLEFPWDSPSDEYADAVEGVKPIKVATVRGTGLDSFAIGNDRDWIDLMLSGTNYITGSARHKDYGETAVNFVLPKGIDSSLSSSSTNPVQNKIVTEALNERGLFKTTNASIIGDGNGFGITDSVAQHVGVHFFIDDADGTARPHLLIQTATKGLSQVIPVYADISALAARVAALEAKLGTAAASVVSGDEDLL